MKKMLFPIILALSPLATTGAYSATQKHETGFLEQMKNEKTETKSDFLGQIKGESKEKINYDGTEYSVTERNGKMSIYPNPEEDFSKKAVVFTYLMKKSMTEVIGNTGDLNRELRLTIKELAQESYDFYNYTKLNLFEESNLAKLANMTTPYEDQLEGEVIGNADNIFQNIKNGSLDWNSGLYGYLNLATSLNSLDRESLENEIEKEKKLKELESQAKKSIEYMLQKGVETIANDFSEYMVADSSGYPKNMPEIAENTIKNDAMNCVGFVDPRAISAMRALSYVMFVDKFLKKEEINLSNFSYEDAKKIYFSPELHKSYMFNLYAYSKIFHSIRESAFKDEVGDFRERINMEFITCIEDILLINDETLNQLYYERNLDKGWRRWSMEKNTYVKKTFELLGKKGMTGLIPHSFVEEVDWSLGGWIGPKAAHHYGYGWWFGFMQDFYKDAYNKIEFSPIDDACPKNNYFRLGKEELEEKIEGICNGLK